MATIKVPRRYQQESVKERRSSGTIPGGPPRGGPERSAGDPRRNPRGGLCGGPERSAKEPQTLHKKTTRQSTNGKRQGKTGDNPKPMVITVEQRWGKGEIEKRWGPLSRTTAWRAGSFWEESNGSVKVFLDKDGKRAEVQVEKLVGKGGPRFWFSKKTPEPPQTQNQEKDKSVTETEDESITEEVDPGVDEVTQDEIQTEKMMWLVEKATSLEDENKELKRALQEMEAKLALQENAVKGVAERQFAVEAAISYFAEHIQRQDVFNESTRSSINGLVEEVKKHQDEFRQMATILQTHQQHIARTGTVSQEMAPDINALILENERKHAF